MIVKRGWWGSELISQSIYNSITSLGCHCYTADDKTFKNPFLKQTSTKVVQLLMSLPHPFLLSVLAARDSGGSATMENNYYEHNCS